MNHPLKNPKSPHYHIYDGLEGIEVIEKVLSTEELIGACKFNILKYQLRMGKKGNADTMMHDVEKIRTYQDYMAYLESHDFHEVVAVVRQYREETDELHP